MDVNDLGLTYASPGILSHNIYHQGMVYGFGSRPLTIYSQNYKIRELAINRGRGRGENLGILSYMLSC